MSAIERQIQKRAIWLAILLLSLLMLSGCSGSPTKIFQHAYFDSRTCSTDPKDSTSEKMPVNPIKCEKPAQLQNDPTSLAGLVVTMTPPSDIAITKKSAKSPKPKASVSAVHAVLACPDSGAPNSSGSGSSKDSGSSTPDFRPCEAQIIRAAMDYCNSNVLREDGDFTKANFAAGAAGLTLGAGAGVLAAAAGAKAATAAVVGGVVTALGTAAGSGGKLLQTPGTVKQGDMVTAAQQYLTVAGPVPTNPCEAEDYYASLFNAVGTACPTGSFSKLHTLEDEIKGGAPFEPNKSFSDAKGNRCILKDGVEQLQLP